MCIAGAWHLLYLRFTTRGRELFHALLPRPQDARDIVTGASFAVPATVSGPVSVMPLVGVIISAAGAASSETRTATVSGVLPATPSKLAAIVVLPSP